MSKYKYIFGPVLSRRLGLSLGVDLVPFKTCSLNCIYCECGPTDRLTIERREYVKIEEVIDELRDFLKNSPDLDYITFSGSGEPTLNSHIGEVIRFIKREFSQYRVAVLTNGTLFTDPSLIDDIREADLILPSLDAASREVFLRINRPHRELDIERIIEGLVLLRERYSGLIYLEIFIVPGVNDSIEEIKRLSEAAKRIRPDKIQLNSLDRPPALRTVKKAEYKELIKIASYFEPIAEIISKYDPKELDIQIEDIENMILEMISRRPCTREEIRTIFNRADKDVDEVLDRLLREGRIKRISGPRGDYLVGS